MCFKFWRTKWLPSVRRKQSSSTTKEKDDNDNQMSELKNEIKAINKVREAIRLRRKENGAENLDENEPGPSKVTFDLDSDPDRYDLDWYLTPPSLPTVYGVDDDGDSEEESDVNGDDDESRCVLH